MANFVQFFPGTPCTKGKICEANKAAKI